VIVLDTNVVSELMRPSPDPRVAGWADRQAPAEVVTSAVTVAEIGYGIARLPAGRRRELLAAAAEETFGAFAARVLPFDASAAAHYASIVVAREQTGTPISGFDAQIAAICRAHGARLATRNIPDFAELGLQLIDPWAGQQA
jgi:toxin FitB